MNENTELTNSLYLSAQHQADSEAEAAKWSTPAPATRAGSRRTHDWDKSPVPKCKRCGVEAPCAIPCAAADTSAAGGWTHCYTGDECLIRPNGKHVSVKQGIAEINAEVAALREQHAEQIRKLADIHNKFCEQEKVALREQLEQKDKLLKLSCEDWAEDDTHIKNVAKSFGVDTEGDGYEFKNATEVVDDMAKLLAAAHKEASEAEAAVKLMRDYIERENCHCNAEHRYVCERCKILAIQPDPRSALKAVIEAETVKLREALRRVLDTEEAPAHVKYGARIDARHLLQSLAAAAQKASQP